MNKLTFTLIASASFVLASHAFAADDSAYDAAAKHQEDHVTAGEDAHVVSHQTEDAHADKAVAEPEMPKKEVKSGDVLQTANAADEHRVKGDNFQGAGEHHAAADGLNHDEHRQYGQFTTDEVPVKQMLGIYAQPKRKNSQAHCPIQFGCQEGHDWDHKVLTSFGSK